ncbi:tumor necrosis factor receptor type 1-associated DEATH domain protein [Xenopus laevis]|uniref:Tumor necrosis factor receptor type 1-associated DEATH domain protein n=3 Tax=Xenopus laevis TaxID=8355 RepID=TRADD_XENLA|nr:tumor necrosis factor receptor type 1-associated DEATH domain protein [Xenopus laevis]XP_018113351.1 tumor necrosis factor receptor type 1-associated DEATH domain protein [Xenopus laevis]XP_041446083.1 tumor necrosis factor receptor type 1-associated DEATH domain protein [Xenopus laevis]XP_041446084.1 tumor necrosis factor receptor type 1-associated DEATH domain protein [Xenopus laevis]XP_041446085.1 tumor necrosis factor receptor type 1-associated DEATH domain protein [Xenopus laevis]Q32NG
MAAGPSMWVGSVYLYIKSDTVPLPGKYTHQKALIYEALRSAISESTRGCRDSIEILKIHSSDQQLILYLKFCGLEPCQRFLKDYKECKVQMQIQNKLKNCFSVEGLPIFTELKIDTGEIDSLLEKEEQCLKYISQMKPTIQKDDELAEIDERLKSIKLDSPSALDSELSLQNSCQCSLPLSLHSNRSYHIEGSTFHFQGEEFVDRPLTSAHIQHFAKSVGKNWKPVGRSLGKTCRALNDTAIENLAYEFDRDGRYEQAYQLLRLFKDSEGKKATVQRLVQALEENGLNSIALDLLSLNENGLK